MIESVCVFCGSRQGGDDRYLEAAGRFGELAARAGLEVIYGGGRVGLMGAVADAAVHEGGRVTGFIPIRLLSREVAHDGISDLVVTDGMFDRKAEMIARADAFVILPGGLGTLDELLEVITLRQLGYHDKPILLVDVGGYWEPFVALVEHVVACAFAGPTAAGLFELVDGVEAALARLLEPTVRQEAAVAAS
jgi:hypothetical protein